MILVKMVCETQNTTKWLHFFVLNFCFFLVNFYLDNGGNIVTTKQHRNLL